MSTEDWIFFAFVVGIGYPGVAYMFYRFGIVATDKRGVAAIWAGLVHVMRTLEQRFVSWADDFTARHRTK